jgi:hypothetical protein
VTIRGQNGESEILRDVPADFIYTVKALGFSGGCG